MATKKAAAKKTAAKKTAAKKASDTTMAPTKAAGSPKTVTPRMTKTQAIRHMAERMEVPPKQIASFLDLLIETATTQTREAGEFTVPGLGKLVKAERKARTGRNPATGESIQIAAKTTVKFRLVKAVQTAVVPPR